ncbi:MAG: CBS domain-containing protein [Nitrospiraceae bacterium]|nr:CBS domain-containing protein [Nitrospiraceae bacterium]MDA8433642.1 CBS domain-containing protein [Nitrospiraceae bacterium]
MVRAQDIMKTGVITVSPETTVEELGRLFIERGISGAPVVSADGTLYGIVTENDLIKQNRRFHIPTIIRLFDAFIPLEGSSSMEKEIRRMSASRVSEICTREVVTVAPETPLQEIATIMSEKGIHLLPVIDAGKIVGIIGKMEVIKGSMGETGER